MKTIWMLVLFVGGLLVGAAQAAQPEGRMLGSKMSEHPPWFKESFLDIAADVEEAKDAGKHVILFMHLNGCPYCYKMVEENFKHAPYRAFIQQHFDVIALNIRGDREVALNEDTSLTEKALAARLKVGYTPTVVFLDQGNQVVARINGYRSVADFKRVLDYVQGRHYRQTTLAAYLDARKGSNYQLRDYPGLQQITDLTSVADKPLALLFEDRDCRDCDALHDGHLQRPEVQEILKGFTFVRLDALSDQPMVAVDGSQTTARKYAESLGLVSRPGIVLFDRGKEITRIESMLYPYHFQEVLRYVGERWYEKYPKSFFDYLAVRSAELRARGEDVNIGE
jgi:thioredoxin-related protein